MSVRVPVMTIGSDSVAGVGDGFCAWQIDVAISNAIPYTKGKGSAGILPALSGILPDCFENTPPAGCLRQRARCPRSRIKKNSERFFCTSNPPVSRGELTAEPLAPLSFFFFAKKFFRGPHVEGRRS